MFRVKQRHGRCKNTTQVKLLGIKTPVPEMKNSVFIIDDGLDIAGEMFSKLEDIVIEMI